MALNYIATIKTRADPWQETFEAMVLKHRLLPVENLIEPDKAIDIEGCPHKKRV
jgi:hypothetical protein